MNLHRSFAVFMRHVYTTRHSPPALFDLFFWPAIDLMIWGVLTLYIRGSNLPAPVGFLIGGVLLWDLLFRSNLGISMSFLDDTSWSRSVLNLLVSPLRPAEYVAGTALFSIARLVLTWGILALAAFALFSFNVFDLGLPLVVFAFAVVVFGVALAMLVLGVVLRFGPGADILAWGLALLLLPISAIYYPVSALPSWLQPISLALPTSHVFESMRVVLAGGATPWGRLGWVFVLDAIYLIAAMYFAHSMFAALRRRGFITRYM